MFLIVGGDSEIGESRLRGAEGAAAACCVNDASPRWRRARSPVSRPWPLRWTIGSRRKTPHRACICAAVARLADCAADPQGSAHVNVTQTLALVDKLLSRGIYVLFLSTNQVFDGSIARVPPKSPHSSGQRIWTPEGPHRVGAAGSNGARGAGWHFASGEGGISAHAAVAALDRGSGERQADQRFYRHDARSDGDRFSHRRHKRSA